jgi:hypothetical protein
MFTIEISVLYVSMYIKYLHISWIALAVKLVSSCVRVYTYIYTIPLLVCVLTTNVYVIH